MDLGWVVTVASPTNPSAQVTIIGNDDPAAPGISFVVDDVDVGHVAAVDRGLEIVYPLSDEEWAVFTTMMRGFSKPVSFQQIFDTLRGLRKEQNLLLTNEQLRTMAKQAINTGLLERSGRGKRVYYSLKAE